MRVITANALNIISTNVSETESLWAVGTTYTSGAIVRYNHRVYKSLVGSNVGNTPSTSPASWQDQGATNAYAMFDEFSNSKTTAAAITVVLGADFVKGLALFGLEGTEVQLTMTHPIEGTVYSETINLRRSAASGTQNSRSWSEYFLGETVTIEDIWRPLPSYGSGTTLTIVIVPNSGTCACSNVVLGGMRELGATQFGASLSITDYSRKVTDEFGRTYLSQGAWARDAEIDLEIQASEFDAVMKAFRDLRAIPCAWLIENDEINRHESTLIYGIPETFKVVLAYSHFYMCSCTLKGLT
jgi:hypothetical protein